MKKKQAAPVLMERLSLIPLRGCVVYPGQQLYLECEGVEQIAVFESAMAEGAPLFLVAQREFGIALDQKFAPEKLFEVGVIAEVNQVQKKNKSSARILVNGRQKASLVKVTEDGGLLFANVAPYPADSAKDASAQEKRERDELKWPLTRTLKRLFLNYVRFLPQISPNVVKTVKQIKEPQELVDYIASNLMLDIANKQKLLELTDELDRMFMLSGILEEEISFINCEMEINEKLRAAFGKEQRDHYIREQIQILQRELGEEEPREEASQYLSRIQQALGGKFKEAKQHLEKEAKRLFKLPPGSQEAAVIKGYLDICLELPWNKSSKERADVARAEKILDDGHFGLEKVKEQILEMVAVREKSPKTRWQILCLVGPPGVGKTSIVRSFAKALNRKYVQISLGGLRDEAEVRGHRKTYVGAMPGKIINAMRTAQKNNPVILLDEIDKMANDHRSDPTSAFLEVLDYEQNQNFKDNYLEVPFDLSNVLFVATANSVENIPAPLYDRMEILELGSYTRLEKFEIIKRHIVPRQLKEYSLNSRQVKFEDAAIYEIIDHYTREAGVRSAARIVGKLCRKATKKMIEEKKKSIVFNSENLREYLGPQKCLGPDILKNNEVGVATGLAWTQTGGETMCLEAISLNGTGQLELTGSLGDVMKESAKAALSYIRKVADQLDISEDFYKNKDIHLHVPEGAVPKDGPSAGTAISAAILSELIKKPVKKDVAITGEITLRGKVLPVGGIKEKVTAAHRVGIKTVVLPEENAADLEEVSAEVRKELNFVLARDVDTVWKTAIVDF